MSAMPKKTKSGQKYKSLSRPAQLRVMWFRCPMHATYAASAKM